MDTRELFGDEFFELDYCPTPEEIAEQCRLIQAGWSDETRLLRMRGREGELTAEELAAGQRAELLARTALI